MFVIRRNVIRTDLDVQPVIEIIDENDLTSTADVEWERDFLGDLYDQEEGKWFEANVQHAAEKLERNWRYDLSLAEDSEIDTSQPFPINRVTSSFPDNQFYDQ